LVKRTIDGAARKGVGIRFQDVSVTLGGVRVLEFVSATVPPGGVTAIIGPNGAGKTTLLLALLGRIPHTGRIAFGEDSNRARIGYVPQRLDFDRAMPVTVADALVMGRQRWPLWLGARKTHRQEAMDLLAAVRAEHLARRRLGILSGGELQRVLLALALQQAPQVLLLDELSAGVDVIGENLLCELLERLRPERHFTQVMVTHDLSLVAAHATHVICLNRRVLGEGAPCTVLVPDVLARTFGTHVGPADLPMRPQGPPDAARVEFGHV
jgi:zinc transport system ATP-binding protein